MRTNKVKNKIYEIKRWEGKRSNQIQNMKQNNIYLIFSSTKP